MCHPYEALVLMETHFRITPVPRERFTHLFSLSDIELAAIGAQRVVVDANPGYPCRVSLVDAAVGERVILTPFMHHDVASPYRSSGPIYVREAAHTTQPVIDEIPIMFRHRLLSVRAYDRDALMRRAQVVAGPGMQNVLTQFFTDPDTAYIHLHNAGPGCFNALVQRA
jgi:hypothetical protein